MFWVLKRTVSMRQNLKHDAQNLHLSRPMLEKIIKTSVPLMPIKSIEPAHVSMIWLISSQARGITARTLKIWLWIKFHHHLIAVPQCILVQLSKFFSRNCEISSYPTGLTICFGYSKEPSH